MIKKLLVKYQHQLFILFLVVLNLSLFGDFFASYLNAEIIGGWDGSSHYAIATYYSENIFPQIYGWVPNYYAGMPFPLFYPPLFYFFIGLINNIFSISTAIVFKSLLVFLTLTLPLVLYRASFKIFKSKKTAFLAGIITTIFLGFYGGDGGSMGISINATFNSGLVTQLLGGWLLFLWLPNFVTKNNQTLVRKDILSISLFTLILLSNAHIVIVTAIIVFVLFLYDFVSIKNKISVILHYFKYFALSLGLAAIWYIPFLYNYNYSTTKTLGRGLFSAYPVWVILIFLVFTLNALIIYLNNKNKRILKLILIFLSLAIFILPLDRIIHGLPIQINRNLPVLFLVGTLLFSYAGVFIIEKIKVHRYLKILLYISLSIPFIFIYKAPYKYMGSYPIANFTEMKPVLEILKDKNDGRSMSEVFTSTIPLRTLTNAELDFFESTYTPSNRELYPKIESLEVLALQTALKSKLDLDDNFKLDGKYGPQTKNAVKQLQHNQNLKVTGVADIATQKTLSGVTSREELKRKFWPEPEINRLFDVRTPKPEPEYLTDHYLMSSRLGINEHKTLWTVFRESSINSIFVQPLRNSFSEAPEYFGTVCYLCDEHEDVPLRTDTVETKIKRALLYNLKYFVVHNKLQAEYLAQYPKLFKNIYKSDVWNIFELEQETSYAEVLKYYPTLVYTDFKTKDRDQNGPDSFDWMRINEEWFKTVETDLALVHAKNNIDETDNLDYFSSLLLVEYNYNSQKEALNKLKSFLEKDRKIFVFPSKDPLYKKLIQLKNDNVINVELSFYPSEDLSGLITEILEYSITVDKEVDINEITFNQNNISISLENPENSLVPIRISSTYFPLWKDKENRSEVYMTSPVLSLVFTEKENISLVFEKNIADRIGLYISLLSVILLGYVFIRAKKE